MEKINTMTPFFSTLNRQFFKKINATDCLNRGLVCSGIILLTARNYIVIYDNKAQIVCYKINVIGMPTTH